jgi:glycosyltransferase involved in cell wall biosynthesis
MKVLFVSSGNLANGINPIVERQGNSLVQKGIDVNFFAVKGKGISGYVSAVFELRKFLKENNVDVIHAHYALCGYVALFAARKEKLVLSFMGSDLLEVNGLFAVMNKFIARSFGKIIVKSDEMLKILGSSEKAIVIPNGVDLEIFKPASKQESQRKLGFDENKVHVLFAADPKRAGKNYELAQKTISMFDQNKYELHTVFNQSTEQLVLNYNAADVILMTSLYEGSPNVIKEAMACNCPIVSTNVGDVKELLENVKGCFVTTHNAGEIKDSIIKASEYRLKNNETNGRDKIIKMELNSDVVADKIISIYKSLVN